MKALLFLIDDSSIGFWKREEEATWSSYLRNCGMTTVEITSITRDMGSTARVVADRLWEARKEEPGSIGLLVTDQQLFGGQFDGSDLAAKLIKEKVVERAVVFSEIACLRPEQLALPLIAESRIRTRAAIANVFRFLETGKYPSTDDLFAYGARIRGVFSFFMESVKECHPEMLRERLFRPARAYGIWEGNPRDAQFLFDPWLMGLGANVVELFCNDSVSLFEEDVKRDVLQYLGPKSDETEHKWTQIRHCLHPWKSLEMASRQLSDGDDLNSGSFRLLIEIARCGGRVELVPSILFEEIALSPRERTWIRLRRHELRSRIAETVNSNDSTLHYCVERCIREMGYVTNTLTRAAAIRGRI